MRIDVNGRAWRIKEVEPLSGMLLVEGNRCCGAAHYCEQIICLSSDMDGTKRSATLFHELSHAFIHETQIERKEAYTEEEMCSFVGMYAGRMAEIVAEYMKGKK